MRCSPVLLAVLTASAAFSFTRPAQAQVPTSDLQATRNGVATSSNTTSSPSTALELADLDLLNDLTVSPLSAQETVTSEFVLPEFSRSVASAQVEVAPMGDRLDRAQAAPVQQTQLSPQTPADQAPIPVPPVSPADPPLQPIDPVVPTPTDAPSPVVPQPETPELETPEPETPELETPESETPESETPEPESPETPEAPQAPTAPSPSDAAPAPSTAEPTAPEPRVLVAEVTVEGAEGDLQNTVYQAIRTTAGRTTTRSQLQEDINAIFATGFFSNVRVAPEDTPLGVRVAFTVEPNPSLSNVRLEGSKVETLTYQDEEVPTQAAIDGIFGSQYGRIINLNEFQAGVEELNKLYQDNGYVLAQVIDAPQVAPNGQVTLTVAEGEIETIQLRFLNRDGDATDASSPEAGRFAGGLKGEVAAIRPAGEEDLLR
ncbi:MAG: hypothetical protein HC781_16895, partial [Leptolyngbyaceae cyanobacterium CSU_1_4]|nr:hypothetical protein [Leptolyngbyaceae cyanobacterium CSU_1_4]